MGIPGSAPAGQAKTPGDQKIAAGRPHGFFNRPPWTEATTAETDRFLASLGYLTGAPTVRVKTDAKLKKE